ncbi:hypothetical protein [uncultured Aquitalea sp.]|uniref:DUF7210 family protein n=1 Tax=uncultured Aquitalea sp. TaxID=540272 RepID=UPI0025EF2524|nr:hypothetical protein [uncultured Aquitalea sp.]
MAKNDPVQTVPVKVLVPVNYDGTLYGPGLPDGEDLEVRKQDLDQLLNAKAVEVLPQAADTPAQ